MRQIWEGVRGKVHKTFDDAQNLQKERDEALVALLNDEQRVKFAKISQDYANRFNALTKKRDATFEEAVEKTKKILDTQQRAKYEEILKTHVRRGPPAGIPPPPAPPRRRERRSREAPKIRSCAGGHHDDARQDDAIADRGRAVGIAALLVLASRRGFWLIIAVSRPRRGGRTTSMHRERDRPCAGAKRRSNRPAAAPRGARAADAADHFNAPRARAGRHRDAGSSVHRDVPADDRYAADLRDADARRWGCDVDGGAAAPRAAKAR